MRALVVGAGPGGCAAALALTRAGVETLVVEMEPELRPAGVGLLLQNSPLPALDGLGLAAECVARGYAHPEIDLCDARGQVRHVLGTPSLVPGLPPAVALSRADLADVLVGAVRATGAELRLGTTVAALTQHPDRVEVSLSDGGTAPVDVVVAADGLHSRTRGMIFPDAPAPRRTGQLIWRAAAPRPPEVERYSMLDGGPELGKVGLVPISDTEVYLWMLQPDRGHERPAPGDLAAALRRQLDPFGGQVPLVSAVLQPEVDLRSLQALLVPPPWSRGRVVLIGDAVHTTTPQIAYGVGMAIEDAVVLGELALADLRGDPAEVPQALEWFTARRYDRCRQVVEASVQLGEWEQFPPADPSLPGRLIGATLGALAAPP